MQDDGTHALAQVFSTNATLTSVNLSDNRIGLPGVLYATRRFLEPYWERIAGCRLAIT